MDDLQAGALNAWTPVQQAALYHEYMARQADEDDKRWLKEYEEEERKKQKKEIEPDSVKAGKIIDDLASAPMSFTQAQLTLRSVLPITDQR